MTSTFLRRKPRSFFMGKHAKVLAKQYNRGGEEIAKDSIVTILRRTVNRDIGLDIKAENGVQIDNVWCEQLELVELAEITATAEELEKVGIVNDPTLVTGSKVIIIKKNRQKSPFGQTYEVEQGFNGLNYILPENYFKRL